MDNRVIERRAVQAHFYNPPEERRRSGYDRRGEYRQPISPGAIRPEAGHAMQIERRSDRSSGME